MISLVCPNCGANLNVNGEGGREFCFCEYCGARVKIVDPNTSTYRYIDEARIREAELNAQIRMKELELQNGRDAQYENRVAGNRRFFRKRLLIYVAIAFVSMLITALIGFERNDDLATVFALVCFFSFCCAVFGSMGHGIAMLIKKIKYK